MDSVQSDWLKSNMQVFWGEIAPCNHLIQVYDSDQVFLNTLEGFAGSGFIADESVIVIATGQHIADLNKRLLSQGFNIEKLIKNGQYIPLDAEESLARFMVNGWPDDVLFSKFVNKVIAKARKRNKKVRAFGEMVAVLWEKGLGGATVHLEHLWNQFCATESFCLFCAYPKAGFTQDANTSIQHLCATHSRIISGTASSSTEIFYRSPDL
jgi:hypothetical protein